MIIISDAYTLNSKTSVNDTFRIAIDDSRVMLQIVASLTDDSRGIIYNFNMFIVLATAVSIGATTLSIMTFSITTFNITVNKMRNSA
jgi:hypothetical protein